MPPRFGVGLECNDVLVMELAENLRGCGKNCGRVGDRKRIAAGPGREVGHRPAQGQWSPFFVERVGNWLPQAQKTVISW